MADRDTDSDLHLDEAPASEALEAEAEKPIDARFVIIRMFGANPNDFGPPLGGPTKPAYDPRRIEFKARRPRS